MIRWQRFAAVTWARSLEFLRDRSTLGWNLLFPLLMVIGFAVVFSGPGRPLFKVAVLSDAPLEDLSEPVLSTPHTQFYRAQDESAVLAALERHRVDLVLDLRGGAHRYWINRESPKGQVFEQLVRGAGGAEFERRELSGEPIRYVDWVLPGLLGMNMMFSCLFGIGYVIVRYRKSGYLKRLSATPLTAVEFICAQLASRLVLVTAITAGMFLALEWLLAVRVDGSHLLLLTICVTGATAMMSMGLVVAARVSSEEVAGGVLNLLSWPMILLSGVFYSLEGAPAAVQWASKLFPLTHMLDAARAVMLDGAGIAAVAPQLLAMGLTAVLFLGAGAAVFRWTAE